MKHKLLRGLVAVILVCCLVVSWSPIRAKAVGVDQFIGVAVDKVGLYAQAGALSTGAAVFSWVLLGLGLIVTTAQAIDLMNQYTEFTGELETSIYYYPDGSWSYGVDMNFVERVRAFLWDEGIVVTIPPEAGEMTSVQSNHLASLLSDFSHVFCWRYDSTWHYGCSNEASFLVYPINSWHYVSLSNLGRFAHYSIPDASTAAMSPTYIENANLYDGSIWFWCGPGDDCTVYSDYELGHVAPLAVPMPEAYPEWHTNSRPATNPDTEEEITVLPIPLNPSADPDAAPDTLTQPDIWQGSIADPMPGTGTVPDGSIAETPWEAFKKWISEGWKTIIQAIPTSDSIAEAVGNVIKSIFVPDADFITEKWNDIRSRFEFADSITATGEVLVNILDGLDPEPPVIYIDLGAAEGSYNIGGEVPFVDLRWYARYKPTMDLIISAFLWLAFVWRLILKLPGIISGMPGEFVLMNLPVNLPHLGIGSGQRREELESGRNNRRLGDGH